MELESLPLLCADSHVEEPSWRWQKGLSAGMRDAAITDVERSAERGLTTPV